MKLLVPKTAAIVITAAAAMLAVPAMASAAPLHVAAKHASKVSVSASPRVANAGTTVKLSATVSSANPKPTGSVTFWWGKHKLCSTKLVNRSGHCNTSFHTAGSYAVRGLYSGDAKHAPATGKVTVVSTKAATSTTISVSSLAPTAGTSVTFNAGVSSHSRLAATGTVRFTSGSTTLCSATLSKGAAHCGHPFAAGSYKVTATYLGDGAHAASHATSGTITVKAAPKATTTTTITGANPNPVDPGSTSTVTVTVTSATGTPTGTVTVAATGADAGLTGDKCTVTLSGGTGSCGISPASDTFGAITLVATYNSDATHNGSKSAVYTLHVPAPTTTTVTFKADTLTADVANPVGNNISPSAGGTGTVTFSIGGVDIAGCTDVPLVFTATSGTGATATGTNAATCAYTPTAAGTVTATYSGDDENQTSMGTVHVTA
jgi:hypothetical protein